MFERLPSFTPDQMNELHRATLRVLDEVGVVFHDDEALAIFRHHGFRVDGRRVFFEERQVQESLETGGEYLSHPTTLARCRTEFYFPALMARTDHATWKAEGGLRTDQRATENLRKRLKDYEKPEMAPAVERDLEQYVTRRRGG